MSNILTPLREIRIFGLSFFDFGLTIIALIIIMFLIILIKKPSIKQFVLLTFVYFIFLMTLGIITHYSFNVNTKLNYILGLSKCPPNPNSLSGIFDC